jgi:hypothetical protein
LANRGDGENAGYCIYGKTWSWVVNQGYCDLMKARIKKLMGIQISDREIYGDAMDAIKENNLFVSHNQMICVDLINYTYFFFDEENQIANEIIKFQNFFEGLSSVAHLI